MLKKIAIVSLIVLNLFLLFLVRHYQFIAPKRNSNGEMNQLFNDFFKEAILLNGEKIPELELQTLAEKKIELSEFIRNRKSVLIIYSEVSCNSCLDSLLSYSRILASYAEDNYSIVCTAYSKDLNYVRRFVRINNLNFPLLWDSDGSLIQKLNIHFTPAVLLLDRNGRIINSFFSNPETRHLNSLFFQKATEFLKN